MSMRIYCPQCGKYVRAVFTQRGVELKCGHRPTKRMILFTVHIPEYWLRQMDFLVKIGRFSSRSELIRYAVRNLLKEEFEGIEREKEVIKYFLRRRRR